MKGIENIKKILAEHRDELREKYGITEIGIFGSYVRGEQKRRSDLDILVEFNKPIGFFEWIDAEEYITKLLKTKVDLVPRKNIRPELREIILREVVYL
ncbi:MAG: nucleotidyltransferase family protein [Thermodesulfovibrionales bacterium]